jgi:hypothetical protein
VQASGLGERLGLRAWGFGFRFGALGFKVLKYSEMMAVNGRDPNPNTKTPNPKP